MKTQLIFKLWDAANLITGFAAVQSLTFAFIFINSDPVVTDSKFENMEVCSICIAILLAHTMYAIGVFKLLQWIIILNDNNVDLDNEYNEKQQMIQQIIKGSGIGRIVAILFFALLDISVILIVSHLVGS